MQFKKYSGFIHERVVFLTCISVLLLVFALCFSMQEMDYTLFWLFGIGAIFMDLLGAVALLVDIRSDCGNVSDVIALEAEGVRFCPVDGTELFIPWPDIASITIRRRSGITPQIIIKGFDGSEIWWFEYEEAMEYIEREHPELEKLISETLGI